MIYVKAQPSAVTLLALLYALLLSTVLANPTGQSDTQAEPRGILPGLFCRHHHTSTCIHYTVTKTKTAMRTCPTLPAKTVTKTRTVTSTAVPAPTDACASVDPRCKPSGFTVDYYANPFFGYSNADSPLGPGYYISEKLKPINSSTTNITFFPQDMIPSSFPQIFPDAQNPTAPYYVGYTRDIDGITVNGNNFTLVYTALYKAPSTGNFTFCTLADNENAVFYGAGKGFPCGGMPSADATPSQTGNVAHGGDYENPTSCFSENLIAGSYYPIRFVMGDYQGPSALGFTVTPPGGTATNDFTGVAYPPSCAKRVG